MDRSKDNVQSLGQAMEDMRLRSPRGGEMSGQNTNFTQSTQVAGGLQARVLAFQQKRNKSQGNSGSPGVVGAGMHRARSPSGGDTDKPLPPLPDLPALPHRSYSNNDMGNRDMIPLPREQDKPILNIPLDPQVLARLLAQGSNQDGPDTGLDEEKTEDHTDLKKKPSLSQRRGMKLHLPRLKEGESNTDPTNPSNPALSYDFNTTGELTRRISEKKNKPNFKLSLNDTINKNRDVSNDLQSNSSASQSKKPQLQGLFASYSKYVDIKSGSLNFAGKASLHSKGIDFLSGSLFRISLDELELLDELGHGNYGVVLKVLHKPTGVLMAMKEVRLELDETKFTQILMELEILHKCDSPYIVDFYGAFFVEGAVYMCMEYMDGGSLDKVYGSTGISDEACLAYITECVIRGLKELKDVHNIIHRDVKPTNILVNTHGKVKLCDFGVSGNLVASLAKTNIGCQSYMAPERIKSLNPSDSSYSVQSDIWSLGLSILEVAVGHYPYPPETYGNIFSQLSAIVDGQPPRLDSKRFSKEAQHFVKSCLNKDPEKRPSYSMLLNHPWLLKYRNVDPHMDKYVQQKVAEVEESKKKSLSRSGSTSGAKPVPKRDNVLSLLKNKVKPPALHRGGLKPPNENFR